MDHPPAPVFHDRQVRVLAPRQARAVEQADGAGGQQEQAEQAAAARRRLCSAGSDGADHQEQPDQQPDEQQDLPARARGRRTRSPDGPSRTTLASESLFWTLIHSPASEPTTITSSAPNRTCTPSAWNFGSLPLTSGPMNRPAASQAVAIQKMPICTCQVRVTL